MTDTALNAYLSVGTTAQRVAFVPNPAVPASGPGLAPRWFDTTLGQEFVWVGGAWVSAGGGGGAAQPEQFGIPGLLDLRSTNNSGPGFFIGRSIVVPRACTIMSVVVATAVTAAGVILTPAIYTVTNGYDIDALLKTGPAVNGAVKGIQKLPLASPLLLAQGAVVWAGFTISGAAFTGAVNGSAAGSVFFASPAAPPNPAATPTYNSTAAIAWMSE